MLLLLLVLLASSLLGRRRFYLRCLSLSLLGRHLRDLGLFRVLVGVFVMAPERDFGEAAMVLLILIFVGIVRASLGHRQRAEQHQADHKAQGSSDCFTPYRALRSLIRTSTGFDRFTEQQRNQPGDYRDDESEEE